MPRSYRTQALCIAASVDISASCRKNTWCCRQERVRNTARNLLPAGNENPEGTISSDLCSHKMFSYLMTRTEKQCQYLQRVQFMCQTAYTEKSRAKSEDNKALITWLLGITAAHSVPHLEYCSLSLYLSKFTGKEYCSSLQFGSVTFWNNIVCLQVTHSSRMMNKELNFGRCWNKYSRLWTGGQYLDTMQLRQHQLQYKLEGGNTDLII